MSNTIDYYNLHANEFANGTVNADMSEHYKRYLRDIPLGGSVLDLGCGSGRDTKYFLSQGYAVTAVDGSAELCRIASEYTGISVRHLLFQDLDYQEQFDGVWACASLLHVPKAEMLPVLKKVIRALKTNGTAYISFKYGTEEREKDSRAFSDYTPEELLSLFNELPSVQVVNLWVTSDVRKEKSAEKWVNLIFQKTIKEECGMITPQKVLYSDECDCISCHHRHIMRIVEVEETACIHGREFNFLARYALCTNTGVMQENDVLLKENIRRVNNPALKYGA